MPKPTEGGRMWIDLALTLFSDDKVANSHSLRPRLLHKEEISSNLFFLFIAKIEYSKSVFAGNATDERGPTTDDNSGLHSTVSQSLSSPNQLPPKSVVPSPSAHPTIDRASDGRRTAKLFSPSARQQLLLLLLKGPTRQPWRAPPKLVDFSFDPPKWSSSPATITRAVDDITENNASTEHTLLLFLSKH